MRQVGGFFRGNSISISSPPLSRFRAVILPHIKVRRAVQLPGQDQLPRSQIGESSRSSRCSQKRISCANTTQMRLGERRSQIRQEIPSETLERHRDAWRQLFLKVESALDLDPAGETAQLLAKQWVLLAEVISGGDSGMKAGAIKAWKDHQNWPLAEQDALFARWGIDGSSDRDASMQRVEKVAKFIGQAMGRKYYEALAATRLGFVDESSTGRSSERWLELFRDVEAALAEDPAGEKAQKLAGRWTELKQDTESEARSTVPRPDDFKEVLRQKRPSDVSVAVVSQVARLYRIEQVANFLAEALACAEEKRNSA